MSRDTKTLWREKTTNPCNTDPKLFETQADPHKSMCPLALLNHARSRASVGCGGSLTSVSATRQHVGIPARRGDQASFQRTALEHGRVSSWSCCRVATQPCWRRFYFIGRSLLEKKRNRYYLVLVSTREVIAVQRANSFPFLLVLLRVLSPNTKSEAPQLKLLKITTRMADAGKRPVRLGMRGPRLNRCAMELAG